MLKLIAVLAVAVAANAAPNGRTDVVASLRDRIEVYRRQMPLGINGGPSLAPYVVPNRILEDQLASEDLYGYNNITSMTIDGFDGFVINALDYDWDRKLLNYTFTYPLLTVRGEHTLDQNGPDSMKKSNYSVTITNYGNRLSVFFDKNDLKSEPELLSGIPSFQSITSDVERNMNWPQIIMVMFDEDPMRPMSLLKILSTVEH